MDIQKAWAANKKKAPLTREEQIEFMKSAKKRREDNIERLSSIVWFNKSSGEDA